MLLPFSALPPVLLPPYPRASVTRLGQEGSRVFKEYRPHVPLTIHWDGKLLMEDITEHQTVDRPPILVSGDGVDQLLAVPKHSHRMTLFSPGI